MKYAEYMRQNASLLRSAALLNWRALKALTVTILKPFLLGMWLFDLIALPVSVVVVVILSLLWFPWRGLITLFPALARKPRGSK